MKERIAIISGKRTPFCKAGGAIAGMDADDLGAHVVRELMASSPVEAKEIDEVIFGNVSQPAHAANVSRVISLKAKLPQNLIAYTVQRNCASGMEAITTAANKIIAGEAKIILVGGAESMSNIPLLFNEKMTKFFASMFRAKTLGAKLATLSSFRLSFLQPIIGVELGLTDPIAGMNMGNTAELLSRDFHVTRKMQDEFALASHLKALKAGADGIHAAEIVPLPTAPKYETIQQKDDGPREGQTYEALAKLKPYFEKNTGTVTVGNACPITDGAAALLLMSEKEAKARGLKPLGYLRDYSYAALEGKRMGLGPVYAVERLMTKIGLKMTDFDLIELNEAFAAQVLGCVRAFGSSDYAKEHFGKSGALGEVDMNKLNVNGGAIALGHPVGATGTRLVLTILHELRRRNKQMGLATLCIGGGQGAALALEVN